MRWLRMSTVKVTVQDLVELMIYQRVLRSPSGVYRLEMVTVYGVVDDSHSMILTQLSKEHV